VANRSSLPDLTTITEPRRLRVFIPAVLRNDSQTGGWWPPKARRARQQIDATCNIILGVLRERRMDLTGNPRTPKRVDFVAYHPPPAFDEPDGLSAAVKHIRDGLRHAGLIHNDGPTDRHTFTYAQVLSRGVRGVLVTVTLVETAGEDAARQGPPDPARPPGSTPEACPLGP
jgi:hypothetical protein